MSKDIIQLLDGKWENGTRPKDLYELYISKEPAEYVKTIIDGLHSDKRRVQSGCAELASLLSADEPKVLYSYIDIFVGNLGAKAPVVRWEAICTLGNLAAIDQNGIIPSHIENIASHLGDRSVVLQIHSVRTLSKIAKAFPERAPEILDSLLDSKELFPENRIGFIIEAMEYFIEHKTLLPKIIKFVKPYTESNIKAVARKAKKIINMIRT